MVPAAAANSLEIAKFVPSPSPSRTGFIVAWHKPGVVVAEIAWRWAFGACALAMVAVAALQLLRATPVTAGDAAVFRGRDSTLMAMAVLHIWQHLRVPFL